MIFYIQFPSGAYRRVSSTSTAEAFAASVGGTVATEAQAQASWIANDTYYPPIIEAAEENIRRIARSAGVCCDDEGEDLRELGEIVRERAVQRALDCMDQVDCDPDC